MRASRLPGPVLPLALLAAGCGTGPSDPSADDLLAALDRCLTPATAERALGPPDEVTGSGLLIHGWRLEGGRTLWLSFPGYRPVVGASVEGPDGTRTEVPLADC